MTLFEAAVLGAVQGITEFIPISSSGHLVLAERFLGLPSNFTFGVLLNFGTLLALLIFFRKKLWAIARDVFEQRKYKFLGLLALATLPTALVGFLWADQIEKFSASAWVVVVALVVIGLLMIVYGDERQDAKIDRDSRLSIREALLIGLAQIVALIPGSSRSGTTILAGLNLGLTTKMATEFSFLMAIPIIFGASMKVLVSSAGQTYISNNFSVFIVGNLFSFIFGALAIKTLLSYLSRHGLGIFGWYRLGLAAVLSLLLITNVI
jgi:undecaprenyl-diphosphatase